MIGGVLMIVYIDQSGFVYPRPLMVMLFTRKATYPEGLDNEIPSTYFPSFPPSTTQAIWDKSSDSSHLFSV